MVVNCGGYLSFKIFFWVGSRSTEYDRNFQETVAVINEMQEKMKSDKVVTKVRYYVEYEYAESF